MKKILDWWKTTHWSPWLPRVTMVTIVGTIMIFAVRMQLWMERRFRRKHNLKKPERFEPNNIPAKAQDRIDKLITAIVLLFGVLLCVGTYFGVQAILASGPGDTIYYA